MRSTMRTMCLYGVLFSLSPVILPAQSNPRVIKVADATALRLSLSESLSSATNAVDDPARFEVTEDVLVGGVVVIAKGSTAVGHVVEVEPKRRLGRAGKLNLTLDHVKAIDGSNLRLRAASARKGDDKTGTVIVGTVLLSPLFLIMRGKDVSIPKGTAINAYVDGDREVTLPAAAGATRAVPGDPVAPPAPPAVSADPSTVVLKSAPEGAEIIVDGRFFGNTPSTVQLAPGDHLFSFEKAGYQPWQKGVTVTPGGIVTINGLLERKEAGREGDLKANR
jgi:hypothetical protein